VTNLCCYKLSTSCSKHVDNLWQAVWIHLVHRLLADLLQDVRFLIDWANKVWLLQDLLGQQNCWSQLVWVSSTNANDTLLVQFNNIHIPSSVKGCYGNSSKAARSNFAREPGASALRMSRRCFLKLAGFKRSTRKKIMAILS
jgi:hypothetical protein